MVCDTTYLEERYFKQNCVSVIGVFEMVGMKTKTATMPKVKTKAWTMEECPACQSEDISTNYFTGEVFCLKCGLVIY